jgi:hypothetical protein
MVGPVSRLACPCGPLHVLLETLHRLGTYKEEKKVLLESSLRDANTQKDGIHCHIRYDRPLWPTVCRLRMAWSSAARSSPMDSTPLATRSSTAWPTHTRRHKLSYCECILGPRRDVYVDKDVI